MQRGHFRITRGGGNAFEQRIRARPVTVFLGEQRLGIQRGRRAVIQRAQPLDHAVGLVGAAGTLVQARQFQPQPRIARLYQQRIFQFDLRHLDAALGQRLLCAGAGQVGTQDGLATGAFLLGRGQPVEQRGRFIGAAQATQQTDQALQRTGVAGLQFQCLAVAAFGRDRITAALQVGQRDVAGGLLELQRDDLLHAGDGIAAGLATHLLQGQPVARGIGGTAPLAVDRGGRPQQFIGFTKALLAQAHRAQPAERLGITRPRAQHLREAGFGLGQVVAVQRAEALAEQALVRVLRRGTVGDGLLTQLRLLGGHLAIVRHHLQEGLVQRRIGVGGVEPQQRLAPGRARRTGGIVGLAQCAQLGDTFAPGRLAIGQHLGQRELGRVVVAGGDTAQAVAGTRPAFGRTGEHLVVLQRQIIGRAAGTERFVIGAHRFDIATGCRRATGGLQLVATSTAAERHAQARGLRRGGMTCLQLLQTLLRFGTAALVEVDQAQAEQRIGLVGIGRQQLAPRIGRQVLAALVLPVVALADQLLRR